MLPCPLCAHLQPEPGECEICGHAVGAASGAAERVAPLDGLEPSAHPAAPRVETSALDALEPTAHPPAGSVAAAALELEPTRVAPLDVDSPALEGLERTGAEPDEPTPLSVFVACRYCRTPALPGERICGRCGMRLPQDAAATGAPDARAGRVCGCGALVRGRACPSCGAAR